MNLFEVLPWNMFSVFTSKNRALYVEALFVLRKAFKQEMTISKSDLVSMLIFNLSGMMVDADFSEDDDTTHAVAGKNTRNAAAGMPEIVNRLINSVTNTPAPIL